MAKYRKKPVVVDCFMWDGNPHNDFPIWLRELMKEGKAKITKDFDNVIHIAIETLEGIMQANPGDYIIQGVKGEIYPCKSDIFEATYERIGE
jgi:hypothetical protein